MEIKIHTTGVVELSRALSKLPEATRPKVLRAALVKAGEPFAKVAKSRARRSRSPWRTGLSPQHMADSIGWRSLAGSGMAHAWAGRAKGRAGDVNTKAGEVVIAGGPDRRHYWGLWVEFGNKFNGPTPFMRPAWLQEGPAIPRVFGVIVWREMERIARRWANQAERLTKGQGRLVGGIKNL